MTLTHWLAPIVHQPSVWSPLSTFWPTARLTTSSVWLQTVNSACALPGERIESSTAPSSAASVMRPGKLKQFQEKYETVFRPELRKNKEIERFSISVKR